MFRKQKTEIENLKQKINQLEKKIAEIAKSYETTLQLLRQQLASTIGGFPPTPSAILSGLGYSEIPKEKVLDFIKSNQNLLILDVRSDEGWSKGHIPNAKHIPAEQVYARLSELPDKSRPILTVCANGNRALTIAQSLAEAGYRHVFNALGGMAGYKGDLALPQIERFDPSEIRGENRELIERVIQLMDRDIRPGLKRDGGDLKILAVEDGIVKLKMVGACLGCGAQKRTVEDGIKNHLMKWIPEIQGVEDWS